MILSVILYVFLTHVEGSLSDKIRANFIKDYYHDRHIRELVIFECWQPYGSVTFAREIMQLENKVKFSKISNDLDMKTILRVNYYRIGVVLDYDCPRSEIVFEEFSKHHLPFNESYHWLVLTSTTAIPTQVLSNLPLSVESELTIANRKENSYVLHDVYNPSHRHNGRLNVTFKGTWTTQDGLRDEMTQYKYIRRGDFHGLTLNFSFVLTNPPLPDFETYMTKPTNRHLDTMMRFNYAIVSYLRDTYNFTMNLKQAPTWGYFVNGTWNGILKDMIDGLTDISIAPFQHKANRMEVCEFTIVTYIGRVVFIFRHPKKNTLRNPFLKPFTSSVWYSIAAISIVSYFILLLLTKMEIKLTGAEVNDASNEMLESEMDLVVVGAISQQGINVSPNIISGRILFISLFLWGLLLYQFYSASIVGSLLAEETKFITNLEQLDASNMELGIEEMPYYPAVFLYGGSPVLLRMYNEKMKPTTQRPKGAYTTARHGLNLVKKGGYALSIESGTAYKIIQDTFSEDEICDLQEIEPIKPIELSIITAKRSPFKKMVTYGIRRIQQHGLLDALTKIWIPSRPICPENHNIKPVPVQVPEFVPALFLLILGSTSAILVMILEHCYKYIRAQFFPIDILKSEHESDEMRKENDNDFNDEEVP